MDVIETVYRERYGRFVRLAHAITGDEQAALDAVHDAFVRAVRHRRSLRDESAAAGWIARIVLNEARRAHPRALPVLEPVVAAGEPVEAVREALLALPERQRLALFLRYYADLDYESIAQALGVARGTVSATLHAAHANLQTHLEEVIR